MAWPYRSAARRSWCAVAGWLVALACLAPAWAAEPAAAPAPPEATISLFNRDIIVLRAVSGGATPAERAHRAEQRAHEVLAQSGEHRATTLDTDRGTLVVIDGQWIFLVAPGDVDTSVGETTPQAAAQAAAALDVVIRETRELRDTKGLLRSAGLALAFSAGYAALLWLLARGHGWLAGRVLGATQRQAERLHIGGAENLLAERVGVIVPRVLWLLLWGLGLLLTYVWLGEVLALFPYTRAWGERLHDYLLGVLGQVGGAMLAAVPNLVIALLILLIARFVTDLVRNLFDRVASGQVQLGWLDRELAPTTRRIANFAIWLFAVAMAYPYLPGAQTDAFKGLSVLVGLMVSIGASSLIGQIASGLILTYSRVVRRGEFVRVGEHEGTVTEMGMFTTRIRTGMGEELTLPNSLILGTVTKNYSRAVKGPGFIVDTTVTIGYDTPWRQVVAMLVEAAHRTDGVLADPAPRVVQVALSDFYPEYRLVCQAVPSQPRPRVEVINALHANIQDVFNEYGVQIMSPHYLGDPAQAKVVPKKDWHLPPAGPAP